jgi:hypothetical protein
MPPVSANFDPGQTDSVEVYTVPHFKSASRFQWQWRFIPYTFIETETLKLDEDEMKDLKKDKYQIVGSGTYDNGDWVYRANQNWVTEYDKYNDTVAANVSGDLRYRFFTGNWSKADAFAIHPNHRPSFKPVIDGLLNMDNYTLRYAGKNILNDSTVPRHLQLKNWSTPRQIKGEHVLVFDITHWGYSERAGVPYYFNNESEARIYVDRDTGQVLRYQARERLGVGIGQFDRYSGMNPSIHVIDFYNHNNDSVKIKPSDYPPYN